MDVSLLSYIEAGCDTQFWNSTTLAATDITADMREQTNTGSTNPELTQSLNDLI